MYTKQISLVEIELDKLLADIINESNDEKLKEMSLVYVYNPN